MNLSKLIKRVLCISLFLISCGILFAQEGELLSPHKIKNLNSDETVLEIDSNVKECQVYLNGIYQGKTKLSISNLVPGIYFLEVVKKGYETQKYQIEIQKGYIQSYKVQLDRIYGTVKLNNFPEKGFCYVDGYIVELDKESDSINLVPGTYEIGVRSFGYDTFAKTVTVEANSEVDVDVELKKADFEILDFSVSKKRFNSEYNNKTGTVLFNFVVTSTEPVKFIICDENENPVFEKKWDGFDFWLVRVEWNGRDKNGEVLADGEYVASIESEHFIFKQNVLIDRDYIFPLVSCTKSGFGIGEIPSLFDEFISSDWGVKTFIPYLMFRPVFTLGGEDSGFTCIEGTGGFCINFANHFELNFAGSIYPGFYEKCNGLYSSFKVGNSVAVGESSAFSYGGLIRYGWNSGKYVEAGKADNGTGIGLGLLAGFDSKYVKVSGISEYIIGSADGTFESKQERELSGNKVINSVFKDSIWRNGLALSILPSNVIALNLYGALNNLSAIEYGGGVTLMPFGSILMNVDFKAINIFNEQNYLSFGIMLSYLF